MKYLRKKTHTVLIYRSVFLLLSLCLVSLRGFAGSWSTESYLVGLEAVHIYEPSSQPLINGKRALMINLHGCLMSSSDMKNNAGWEATAEQFGMVVAAPDVPGGGYANTDCWNYYGQNHTRTNKYNNEIIALAEELLSRSSLNIDPNQVYITGFSSGGGQANVIACLAPDIFAGVGSASGPGLGTSNTQYGSVPWNYSEQNMADLCLSLAGGNAIDLSTQIYSTIHGNSDTTVAYGYNDTGAQIMKLVYDTTSTSPSSVLFEDGTVTVASDSVGPRVSKISVAGLPHAWSARNGGNSGFFVNTKVDYPQYVTQWFFDNNRRVNQGSDNDGDGYGSILDCNDNDASIYPDAPEVCSDGIDQNCSGADLVCNTWECQEYTTYNINHYYASPRRATVWYVYYQYHYYATGNGQELALTGPYAVTTVSETSEGYFEPGSCPNI